ncbi:hypothetical protein ACIRBY_34135 [Streptomyces sp. NPDC096136]|uniref:hypothetical protein n=1 Tax=Streptomyces sp. NPDC096136 TaxID=3366076 RepID=UPI00381411F3
MGLLLTTGNVLGLAVLALSCADQADGATAVPSITVPDQAPAEAQPPSRTANDTAHTLGPAARTTESRACRCGSHPRTTL